MRPPQTISRRTAAAAIITIGAIGAIATWTLTRPADTAAAPAEIVTPDHPTTSQPPPPTVDLTAPTTADAATPTSSPPPTASPQQDVPTPTTTPSTAAAVAGEFNAAQRHNALAAVRETLAKLEVVQTDGTRPDIPHVDPTSWLATTPFDAPPPVGLRRSVTDITTDIVAGDTQTLYIHATWHIHDHKPDTTPTADNIAGPQRDFVVEAVHQQPGWLINELHPELPPNAAHEPATGTNPNG